MNASPALEFRSVRKAFGSCVACHDLSFSVKKGTIHGLVGENGAGKSTAMKLLFGTYPSDQGVIKIDGQEVHFKSPLDSRKFGIGMVFQHFMLAEPHSVIDHFLFSCEMPRGFSKLLPLQRRDMVAKVRLLMQNLGMQDIPLETPVERLSLGDRQRVEILKALYCDAKILILDEPTAVLTPQETTKLLELLRELKSQGKTIIFISHKLEEILEICDDLTVIRAGRDVAHLKPSACTKDSLAEAMVGHPVRFVQLQEDHQVQSQPVFTINQLSAWDEKKHKILDRIHLEIFPGEIIGVAGINGNGQSELIEYFQKKSNLKFQTESNGSMIPYASIGMIPEDRHRDGLLLNQDLSQNILLGYHDQQSFSKDKLKPKTEEIIRAFDVRPPETTTLSGGLSGGNQQKLIVGREISKHHQLLICAHPTRGVDVGAIELIYEKLLEERKNGAAILLISSQLEEIFALSDRIVVMFEGKMSKPILRKQTDFKKIGLLMAGVDFE